MAKNKCQYLYGRVKPAQTHDRRPCSSMREIGDDMEKMEAIVCLKFDNA